MFTDQDTWKLLVQAHNYTKFFLLKAEEIDPRHQFFYPPLIQQRDALDHIMRAAFARLYPEEYSSLSDKDRDRESDPDKYAERQLDKALGHAYRAMFDAGDWLGIIYRERVRELMAAYSVETINKVLPEFRPKVEPRIEAIGLETAALRGTKDIGNKKFLIKGAEEYKDLIDELEGYWQAAWGARASLDRQEFGQSQEPQ